MNQKPARPGLSHSRTSLFSSPIPPPFFLPLAVRQIPERFILDLQKVLSLPFEHHYHHSDQKTPPPRQALESEGSWGSNCSGFREEVKRRIGEGRMTLKCCHLRPTSDKKFIADHICAVHLGLQYHCLHCGATFSYWKKACRCPPQVFFSSLRPFLVLCIKEQIEHNVAIGQWFTIPYNKEEDAQERNMRFGCEDSEGKR